MTRFKTVHSFKRYTFHKSNPQISILKDIKTLNIKKQIYLYYKPKIFEFYRDKTIYDLIGIRIFKKYLPTTGDLVRRRMRITQIKVGNSDRLAELYKYERKTRNYEWRHLIGVVIFIFLSTLIERKFSFVDWVLLITLNLCINIYPIFLQRYNRIRIIKVLQKNGLPGPYGSV